jgi:hypothetical protein
MLIFKNLEVDRGPPNLPLPHRLLPPPRASKTKPSRRPLLPRDRVRAEPCESVCFRGELLQAIPSKPTDPTPPAPVRYARGSNPRRVRKVSSYGPSARNFFPGFAAFCIGRHTEADGCRGAVCLWWLALRPVPDTDQLAVPAQYNAPTCHPAHRRNGPVQPLHAVRTS